MMVITQPRTSTPSSAQSHYCPHCLRRVCAGEAQRQEHHEACNSGAVDVSLLRCPTCGLVLSAEVQQPPETTDLHGREG